MLGEDVDDRCGVVGVDGCDVDEFGGGVGEGGSEVDSWAGVMELAVAMVAMMSALVVERGAIKAM